MRCNTLFLSLTLLLLSNRANSQYLSRLAVTRDDALFTTYAAPPQRSQYQCDQAYQFQWMDEQCGLEFISKDGPNLGMAFKIGSRLAAATGDFATEPIITASYSDLVKYFYYPFENLRVEAAFVVYSSQISFLQVRIINESKAPIPVTLLPYLYLPASDSLQHVQHQYYSDGFTCQVHKKRDGWMLEHHIPLEESFKALFSSNLPFDSVFTFSIHAKIQDKGAEVNTFNKLKSLISRQKRGLPCFNGVIGCRSIKLHKGEAMSFNLIVQLSPLKSGIGLDKALNDREIARILNHIDVNDLIKDDEHAYSAIPKLKFTDRDKELLYWSAFSLMRQCMMPPEGECRRNYYIFSREPKWGWGYGGQVFHESLAASAYCYMDPEGAMNSQRVYMDRQRKDGYINYRTGPYLNETIETNGKSTTSAPWYNYENLEIYKVTKDLTFLKEAYESGSRFYRFYVASRDSNNNGLCEWGAHAELESVRDARVAVWDKVGWPSNFEGPDVNAMLVREAKSLAEMAEILSLPQEALFWQKDAKTRSDLINRFLWDPETDFYYNVNKSDQQFTFRNPRDLKIKEIIGFLPLWAGIPDSSRAKLLITSMLDSTEFWRPFGIPSLSAREDYYCPIGYWNGPVWVQWEYLLFRGLKDYGYHQIAEELANRVMNNMIYHLKSDHQFWEFYSADDHQAGWNKTYFWAGIATRFMIDGVR